MCVLSSWDRVRLEKKIVLQLVKKSSHFRATELSFPCSQEPATCRYSGLDQSSPHALLFPFLHVSVT